MLTPLERELVDALILNHSEAEHGGGIEDYPHCLDCKLIAKARKMEEK